MAVSVEKMNLKAMEFWGIRIATGDQGFNGGAKQWLNAATKDGRLKDRIFGQLRHTIFSDKVLSIPMLIGSQPV